jgi:hypothetical protein
LEGTSSEFVSIKESTEVMALLAALAYGAGFLIVNIDLGAYGLLIVDFARPEYILAGAVWIAATALPIVGFSVIPEVRKPKRRLCRFLLWVLCIFAVISIYLAFLGIITNNRENSWGFWARSCGCAVGTVVAYYSVRWWPLKKATYSLWLLSRFAQLIILLAALFMYSREVFPYIPREWGGGRKPIAIVFLNQCVPVAWKKDCIKVRVFTHGPIHGAWRMKIKFGLISADSHAQLDRDAFTKRMSKARFGDRVPHVAESCSDDRAVAWVLNCVGPHPFVVKNPL